MNEQISTIFNEEVDDNSFAQKCYHTCYNYSNWIILIIVIILVQSLLIDLSHCDLRRTNEAIIVCRYSQLTGLHTILGYQGKLELLRLISVSDRLPTIGT